MKGDFSQIRFNPGKHYTSVLQQQGRVALDADANEQCAIDNHLDRTETVDVVGEYGAPIDDAGFAITIEQDEIFIGKGRYYVEGLMCENPTGLSYGSQPYLIDPSPTDSTLLSELLQQDGKSVIQVYLQVWQRLVTALDDPCLREPALGRADTTARLQTVWRVLAALVPAPSSQKTTPDCCAQMYAESVLQSTGKMSAATSEGTTECSCQPIPAAGYQGLENQLYRVEIHQAGDETAATFKWSRENGSVVAAIENISGYTIWVNSLGPDANLGFQANQWVEITDDTYLFGQAPNQTGLLYEIESIDPVHLSITMSTPVIGVETARNARVRRWDQSGASADSTGVPLSANTWLTLENGIQVNFTPGTYQSGDFWTIPARTASGQIEWPPCGGNGTSFQPPHSTDIYQAPLACIHWNTKERATHIDECRRKFSPLTALTAPVTPKAIHITGISWQNDDVTTLDQLVANGLTIILDQAPSGPVNGANFIVTFEPATAPTNNNDERAIAITRDREGLPSTILRGITIVDSKVILNAAIKLNPITLSWTLPFLDASFSQRVTVAFLDVLLSFGAPVGWFARARVKLLGRAIFKGSGAGQIFLDGQSFGQAAVRSDGETPRIDLQLPSGDGAKASDFEGWFYVAPTLQIVSVLPNFLYKTGTLTVVPDSNNSVTGVVFTPASGGTSQPVNPQATVTVSYPAIAETAVALALSGASGVGTVASIPSTVQVNRNQTTATFAISILSNPGAGTTLTFQITASMNSALGPVGAQNFSFTVTGQQPPEPVD
jgi:Family of unknown function (DUF6519)